MACLNHFIWRDADCTFLLQFDNLTILDAAKKRRQIEIVVHLYVLCSIFRTFRTIYASNNVAGYKGWLKDGLQKKCSCLYNHSRWTDDRWLPAIFTRTCSRHSAGPETFFQSFCNVFFSVRTDLAPFSRSIILNNYQMAVQSSCAREGAGSGYWKCMNEMGALICFSLEHAPMSTSYLQLKTWVHTHTHTHTRT